MVTPGSEKIIGRVKNSPEMNVSRRVNIARHPVSFSIPNRHQNMNYLGGACFFQKKNHFFPGHPWIIFKHLRGSPKLIGIVEKTSEMNVSRGVHIARYPVFYSAPNSHGDMSHLVGVFFFEKKNTFR